jgi:CubicO group peptidase (beta-lactamase class C family)
MFPPEFQALQSVFADLLHRRKLHSAAQIVVRRHGRVLVNHAEGRGAQAPVIQANTPFLCFSISKAFTGLCIHKLIEEGRVELDAPVARYWPEFGCKGKESATIRHVFLHQAGIPAPGINKQVFTWPFWPLVTRNVAATPAVYPPGTHTAYHLVNYGFIFGEVIRRVTGMQVEEYLSREFLRPMGLTDTWMRLPAKMLGRTPRLETRYPVMQTAKRLFSIPSIRTARLPAASLHSSACDLSAVFQMLLDDGEWQGKRLLQPETVRFATSSGYFGWDDYIHHPMHWGYGFILGRLDGQTEEDVALGRRSTSQTFSAMGMGTNMVWADRPTGTVVGFTCNGMLPNKQAAERWSEISNAVWDGIEP